MRKLILTAYVRMTVVATAMMLIPSCSDGNVKINEKNFPDESFRACLLEQDYGQDDQLTAQEIAGIERIDAEEMGICSLKGIEFFTSLKDLRCWGNQLTELDASSSAALSYLNCSSNQLSVLDLAPFQELNYLVCANNQIGSEAMKALIWSLRKGDDEQLHPSTLCLCSEDEGEKNVCSAQMLAMAKAKKWRIHSMKDGQEKE